MRRAWMVGLVPWLVVVTLLAAALASEARIMLPLPVPANSAPAAPIATPDMAPVTVQAWVPFVYHDPSALGETLVCVSSKAASPIPPLMMAPTPPAWTGGSL